MRILILMSFALILAGSCKKRENTPVPSPVFTSAKMKGDRIGIGYGMLSSYSPPPDAFSDFNVTVIDNNSILIYRDTLTFHSVDSVTGAVTFLCLLSPWYNNINRAELLYDPVKDVMTYSYQYYGSTGGGSFTLETEDYRPYPIGKSFVSNIAGKKLLSGKLYDSSSTRDTFYEINSEITFSSINDSTIYFHPDLLSTGDSVLHYRSNNEIKGTITFQSFHVFDFIFSTLTYDYRKNELSFEQYKKEYIENKKVVLK